MFEMDDIHAQLRTFIPQALVQFQISVCGKLKRKIVVFFQVNKHIVSDS